MIAGVIIPICRGWLWILGHWDRDPRHPLLNANKGGLFPRDHLAA